jgi:hypothetical protein
MTLDEKRKIFRNALNSHDGKLMLEILVQDYQECRMLDADPYKTTANAACYELVQLIKDLSRDTK